MPQNTCSAEGSVSCKSKRICSESGYIVLILMQINARVQPTVKTGKSRSMLHASRIIAVMTTGRNTRPRYIDKSAGSFPVLGCTATNAGLVSQAPTLDWHNLFDSSGVYRAEHVQL